MNVIVSFALFLINTILNLFGLATSNVVVKPERIIETEDKTDLVINHRKVNNNGEKVYQYPGI